MTFSNRSRMLLVAFFLCFAVLNIARAQDTNDLDNYKWRVDGDWWYSHPFGYFGVNKSNNYFDVNKDFGFGSYSTFTGKLDWHFAHKHHFLLIGTPNYNSKTATANREIDFQGQTFDVGAQVKAELDAINVAPGYQYDIIRRDHGFLGLEVDLNFIKTTAKLSLAGNVNGRWPSLPLVSSPRLQSAFNWRFVPGHAVLWLRKLHDGSCRCWCGSDAAFECSCRL